jgi:gliding motility-associated-like protein
MNRNILIIALNRITDNIKTACCKSIIKNKNSEIKKGECAISIHRKLYPQKMKLQLLQFIIATLIILASPMNALAQYPDLGTAKHFALFTANGALTNAATSTINGNIGSHVGAITGFDPPTVVNGTIESANSVTAQCAIDVQSAYNELAAIPPTVTGHTPAFGTGETIFGGVYSIAGAGSIAGNLTLDAQGDPSTMFIFKFAGAFDTGASSKVHLINGALACNVFWIAEGAMSMAAVTDMKGSLISLDGAVSMGAGCTLDGRMLTTNGAVYVYDVFTSFVICCDLAISAATTAQSCSSKDGSIDLTIMGPDTYDVFINGVPYAPLDNVTENTYNIPNLSNGTYEIMVSDTLFEFCEKIIKVTVLAPYYFTENVTTCLNWTVTYPDGSNEVISENTSHTSELLSIEGCDSVIVTNVTITPTKTNTVNELVCFGALYTSPQGKEYGPGSFDETYTAASGCDSVVTYVVTERLENTNTVNESVCIGELFTSPTGKEYGPGSFDETNTSAYGCDSVVTYVVTERPKNTNTVNETVCFEELFTSPTGKEYGPGSFDETYESVNGCDSIVTYVVSERLENTNTVNETVCFEELFTSPTGKEYGPGSFEETYEAASGCDSVVTYVVSERPENTNTVNETVCFEELFTSPTGKEYGPGSFDETYEAASGCDSVVTYVVGERLENTSTVNETVCFEELYTSPTGNKYGPGSFDETYESVYGCDSVVTYTVSERLENTSTVNETVCFEELFTSPTGKEYGPGSFDETYKAASGCDSVVTYVVSERPENTNTVNETVCFEELYTSPTGNKYGPGSFDETYEAASGCDSVVTYVVSERLENTNTVNETVCFEELYTSPTGNKYGPGSFDETYKSINGCDSVVTYIVSERLENTKTVNETVCFEELYTSPTGNKYGPGSFDETYKSIHGCDSVVTYIVSERIENTNTVNETVCFEKLYTSPTGKEYGPGSFDETYKSVYGCDSVVTFVISERLEITNTVNVTVCFNERFTSQKGTEYGPGSHIEIYTSASGCDSTVTYIVSERLEVKNTVNELVCFNYLFTSPKGKKYGPGSHNEIYTAASGCDSTVTFIVSERLEVTNTVNETVCFEDYFTSPKGIEYGPGSYNEIYTSVLGCDSTVTFIVNGLPAITNTVVLKVCYGGQHITNEGVLLKPGRYTEVFKSTTGCDSTYTLVVSEYDKVSADFDYNSSELTALKSKARFENTSSKADLYTWDFGDKSPKSNEVSPIHQFELFEAGTYDVTLIAQNEFDCTDTIVKTVMVQEELVFYIPNSFTPNGDGFNQMFMPVFTSGFNPSDYTLMIFNRSGTIIFESHDLTNGWDGKYKNEYVQEGLYIYKVLFKELSSQSDELEFRVGHVNMSK